MNNNILDNGYMISFGKLHEFLIILSIPVDDLELKLFAPGGSKRRWRKAMIITIRVIRYVVFQVIPNMKERILEEAIPYHCIAEIWKRDRRAGRPANALLTHPSVI